MNTIPFWLQLLVLVGLIACSAFFSMTETALMSANRYRLRHLARRGNPGAATTLWLLDRLDKLLAIILIANTLFNALITALVTIIAIATFGDSHTVIIVTTAVTASVLIVFAEISPKIIGATYPERIVLPASFFLKILMKAGQPVTWFVNLFVGRLLKLSGVKLGNHMHNARLSFEELRSVMLEGGNFIPQKHRSIFLNLFDLESVSVEDVMVPRSQIEALDFSASLENIKHQLTSSCHDKLPVYEEEINRIIGILPVRKALVLLSQQHELTVQHLRQLLTPPYFIPEDTCVITQLQYFQEQRERLGMIVDEYGEVQGLVTLDDIIEEIIGEFTTLVPGEIRADSFDWSRQGQCIVDGTTTLRDINKRLHLELPVDGPKTLNGLLLEILQDIPDAPVCVKMKNCIIEIIQVQNQTIKVVKLVRVGI